MFAKAVRVTGTLVVLALLVAGCQPIQPVQPEGAVAPAAEEAAAGPALVQRDFPLAGLSVGLPEGWFITVEPNNPCVRSWSEVPFGEPNMLVWAWPYVFEEPVVEVTFCNAAAPDNAEGELARLLERRFNTLELSDRTVYPSAPPTVLEPAVPLTAGDQAALRMVLAAEDDSTGLPMHMHVYAILSGDRLVYVSSALTPENEARFAPLVEQIVQSVGVGAPQPEPQPTPHLTGEVAPGETVSGTLVTDGSGTVTRDYWRVDGKKGAKYYVTLITDAGNLDIIGQFVDAAGAPLTPEVDDGGGGVSELLSFKPAADGEFYVAVRGYHQAPGPYRLELVEMK